MRNSTDTWGTVAKSFHWIVALLILGQFALGKIAEGMKLSPAKLDLFVWHKSVGVTVLLLVVLRLAWRFADPPPAPPANTPAWETKLAVAGHYLLYVLMFAVPISGWWVSDASRVPFKAYFAVPMPDLIETNRSVQEIAEGAHEILVMTLVTIAIGHVVAALRHHFWLKDGVMRRMLPWQRNETRTRE